MRMSLGLLQRPSELFTPQQRSTLDYLMWQPCRHSGDQFPDKKNKNEASFGSCHHCITCQRWPTRKEYRFCVSTYRDLQIYTSFLVVLSYTNQMGHFCKPGDTKLGELIEKSGKERHSPQILKRDFNLPRHSHTVLNSSGSILFQL